MSDNIGDLNAFGARQYWKKLRPEWERLLNNFVQKALAIEDEKLRDAVADCVVCLSNKQGDFLLSQAEGGFHIEAIRFDDVFYDTLVREHGDAGLIAAYDWLLAAVRSLPAPFLGWGFGMLSVKPEELVVGNRKMVYFAYQRMVYSVEEKALIGVMSHADASHPKAKVHRINLEDLAVVEKHVVDES